ncbi:MAG: RnfABCDGE type electron transport complex subunit B [Bacteroidales bacterium]|nr:RnfABCDGE type electron transport complex subunit B [Bacteroidales bacterium]
MNQILIISVVALTSIGVVAAIILYVAAKKFHVEEDERIGKVVELLPGANCGGCGFAGCKSLAEAIVKAGNMEGLHCPAGGNETMAKIADVLGIAAEEATPQVAVVRCSGSIKNAPAKIEYDGITSCAFANSLSSGETGCRYGCLGLGDCVKGCSFGAISISEETGLPVVDYDKCGGCGGCARRCPRGIIEVRNRGPKDRRVFVSCINAEKGAVAKKNCAVACIGCGKCVKVCPFGAITLDKNHAYIDFTKCKMCLKCVAECPTGAIHAVNFPVKKTEEIS